MPVTYLRLGDAMYQSLLLLILAVALAGCASDTPRITSGTERPKLDEMRAPAAPVPLSVAIHITNEALKAHAVEHHPGDSSVVWDYGALGDHLSAAVVKHAPKAFERVFYTPLHPNPALWKEGIEAVVSIESARANFFTVKDGSRPDGKFYGWEVVLVVSVSSIDGRPLGFHADPPAVRRAHYRTEVVAPPSLDEARDKAFLARSKACNWTGDGVNCMAESVAWLKVTLADAVDVAVGQALRSFPATEMQRYLAQYTPQIDWGYGAYLARKDDPAFVNSLRADARTAVAGMTPPAVRPTIDKTTWYANLMRTSAMLSALSGAVSGLQAQNYARMGMHQQAQTSAMVSQMNKQLAQQQLDQLSRAGAAGLDANTQGLLTLLGGIGSYYDYRMSKAGGAALAGGGKHPRCSELLRNRDIALQNQRDLRSPGVQTSSGRSRGQAGAQQEAADLYQRVYNTYCT